MSFHWMFTRVNTERRCLLKSTTSSLGESIKPLMTRKDRVIKKVNFSFISCRYLTSTRIRSYFSCLRSSVLRCNLSAEIKGNPQTWMLHIFVCKCVFDTTLWFNMISSTQHSTKDSDWILQEWIYRGGEIYWCSNSLFNVRAWRL